MSEIEECDYWDEQVNAQTDITAQADITPEQAFEQQIPYGFTRGITTLKVVNRLLALQGLEIAALDADYGREIAFIIREKE
jgi:hypothetical protein